MAFAKRYGFLILLLFVIPLITLVSFAFNGTEEVAYDRPATYDHGGEHGPNSATPSVPLANPFPISNLSADAPTSLTSEHFKPTLLSECPVSPDAAPADTQKDRTQQSFAPCIRARAGGNKTNMLVADEVVYPLFKIRLPKFPNPEHRAKFLQLAKNQHKVSRFEFSSDDEWLHFFRDVYGQNMVFENVRIPNLVSGWSDFACMGVKTDHKGFLATTPDRPRKGDSGGNADFSEGKATIQDGAVVIATSPDSNSFQHFLDRVTNLIIQSQLSDPHMQVIENQLAAELEANRARLIKSSIASRSGMARLEGEVINSSAPVHLILGSSPTFSSANFFLSALSVRSTIPRTVQARRVKFSCRTPLIHPYHMMKFSELTGVFRDGVTPLAERKNIVYFTRRGGGSRKIANEQDMIASVEELLMKRGKGEKLVVMEKIDGRKRDVDEEDRPEDYLVHDEYGNSLRAFAKTTRAIIGPHGGALYNARFAFPQTLVIEFQPLRRFGFIFLEQSRCLQQQYGMFLLESGGNDEMTIDIPALIAMLEADLGVERPISEIIQKVERTSENDLKFSYPWDI